MRCEDLQESLAIYADNELGDSSVQMLEEHLAACPVCRSKLVEYHSMKSLFRGMSYPETPANFVDTVRYSVATELGSFNKPSISSNTAFLEWLQMRLMPYAVGTVASLALGFAFLLSLQSARSINELQADNIIKVAPSRQSFAFPDADMASGEFALTKEDYAALRIPVSGESPSLNPSGALVALTKSLVRGKMNDDEVVVVADVFGDGVAKIAEVVEAPREKKSLEDLEKALQDDPTYAPFVPADLDHRSDVVRVVLKIQRVDVIEKPKGKKPAAKRYYTD